MYKLFLLLNRNILQEITIYLNYKDVIYFQIAISFLARVVNNYSNHMILASEIDLIKIKSIIYRKATWYPDTINILMEGDYAELRNYNFYGPLNFINKGNILRKIPYEQGIAKVFDLINIIKLYCDTFYIEFMNCNYQCDCAIKNNRHHLKAFNFNESKNKIMAYLSTKESKPVVASLDEYSMQSSDKFIKRDSYWLVYPCSVKCSVACSYERLYNIVGIMKANCVNIHVEGPRKLENFDEVNKNIIEMNKNKYRNIKMKYIAK